MRYWVFFENGVDLGSIGSEKLVRARAWPEYQAERERRAALGPAEAAGDGAAVAVPQATGDAAAEAPADGGAASRIPAHLLERTKNRRQALGI